MKQGLEVMEFSN